MKEKLKEFIPYVVILLIVIIIRTYIVTPVIVNGVSMEPTLEDGQILILNKIKYSLHGAQRFNVVVIKNGSEPLIKRVIGLPGEHIKYENKKLYVNSEMYHDDYAENTLDFDIKSLGVDKVPDGKYLVLGDNRKDSLDSRIIGLIDAKDIEGITNLRLYPFDKIGNINK